LLKLTYLDMIASMIIDPMHSLFLGAAKKILKMFYLKRLLDDRLEKRLRDLKVPRHIGRVISAFRNVSKKAKNCGATSTKPVKLKKLKAAELKDFVIIYSDTLLEDLLPAQYYKMWTHFSRACKLICRWQIRDEDFEAMYDSMHTSLCLYEELFGASKCTPNLHFCLEIIPILKEYGPAHVIWCFAMERMNGTMGDIYTNGKNIPVTVMSTHKNAQQSKTVVKDALRDNANMYDEKLQEVPKILSRDEDKEDDTDAINFKKLKKEMTFTEYRLCVALIGSMYPHSDYPWGVWPALMVQELDESKVYLGQTMFNQLKTFMESMYVRWYPSRLPTSVYVTRMTVATSNKLRVFDSIVGTKGTQSDAASFIQVYREVNGKVELCAAQVISFYEICVVHAPECRPRASQLAVDSAQNHIKEIQERGSADFHCTFAYVDWFERKSSKQNQFGEVQHVYHNKFEDASSEQWVPVRAIYSQFIPFYTTCKVNGVMLPVMKVCPVELKTPY
jgi:hypothetical protein